MTLANVNEVKRAVIESLQGLSGNETLGLDGAALGDVDLAGLQLLCATSRLAAAQGKRVVFTAPPGLALARTANDAGFGPDRGCPADCLCMGVLS